MVKFLKGVYGMSLQCQHFITIKKLKLISLGNTVLVRVKKVRACEGTITPTGNDRRSH